jgi:hypothetical protein
MGIRIGVIKRRPVFDFTNTFNFGPARLGDETHLVSGLR